MNGFLPYLIVSIVISPLSLVVDRFQPNAIILKCGSCGSKLYQNPKGRWRMFADFVWQITCWVVVWRLHPPVFLGVSLVLVLVFFWNSGVRRVTHSYWMWQHPFRCQTGGHANPATLFGYSR